MIRIDYILTELLPMCKMNVNLETMQPDYSICSECGEHAEFDTNGSECCGSASYDSDPDIDT